MTKLVHYDSTTGTGDNAFTTYVGGTCIGATFDGSGATEFSTGTDARTPWFVKSFLGLDFMQSLLKPRLPAALPRRRANPFAAKTEAHAIVRNPAPLRRSFAINAGFAPGRRRVDCDPSPIGFDDAHDIIAASRHAIPTIGALWGYGDERELREAGAAALCVSPAEVPHALAALPLGPRPWHEAAL